MVTTTEESLTPSTSSSTTRLCTCTSSTCVQAEEILIKNGRAVSKLEPNNVLHTFSLGERIQGGRTILKLSNLVTPDEIKTIVAASLAAAEERKLQHANADANANTNANEGPGKVFVRLLTQASAERDGSPNDALPEPISNLVDRILLRAMTFLDEQVCPSLKTTLFGSTTTTSTTTNTSIAQLFRDNQLTYSSREPAINVYEAPDGHFFMHKDHHALSIVIPLSCPKTDFEKGGTAFWNQSHPMEGMDRPSLILKPPPGHAMVWGGRVSHKGMPIVKGKRVVLVASFSGPEGGAGDDVRERLSAGLGVKTILSGR